MDAVFLARIQFGLTAGFHFLFPPTTLGLSFIILIFETLFIKTKNMVYRDLSAYLIRVLGIVFVMGVATGITLEFAFGNNWATYSRTVGDIFGAPPAASASARSSPSWPGPKTAAISTDGDRRGNIPRRLAPHFPSAIRSIRLTRSYVA